MGNFKRDSETLGRVYELLKADNLTSEQKTAVESLVADYERCTYNDWCERHEFYRGIVESMVNDFGFQYKELAEKMANNHPTLQQSFMRMCANFIQRMAEKSYCDDRNRTSVEYAKSIMDNVGEEYFPFV